MLSTTLARVLHLASSFLCRDPADLQIFVGTGAPTNSTASDTGFQLVSGLTGNYIDR